MRLTLEPTDKVVRLQERAYQGQGMNPAEPGLPARVWEGTDEHGTPVICFVTRILVAEKAPHEVHARFARELQEVKPASPAVQAFDLRFFID